MSGVKLKELLTKESLLEKGVNGLEEKFDELFGSLDDNNNATN